MVSEEFKLNLYYNIYKNSPIASREKFRKMFWKKHGRFQYLPELIYMIERYQSKKFGSLIYQDTTYNYDKKMKGRR